LKIYISAGGEGNTGGGIGDTPFERCCQCVGAGVCDVATRDREGRGGGGNPGGKACEIHKYPKRASLYRQWQYCLKTKVGGNTGGDDGGTTFERGCQSVGASVCDLVSREHQVLELCGRKTECLGMKRRKQTGSPEIGRTNTNRITRVNRRRL